MLLEISEIVKPIVFDRNVQMVVLYRIDGIPLLTEIKERNMRMLNVLFHLENQIKSMLYYIFNRNIDEVSFKFKDTVIRMYPISRTLVLAIMASDEFSLYKLEADIESVCDRIRELVRYERKDDLHAL